ncbi:MAG: hypothetical protein KJS97_12220 [Alphaproteobacteria bacterium]|nr:hypothetical protein [Alphaproteobacteria bacterium]
MRSLKFVAASVAFATALVAAPAALAVDTNLTGSWTGGYVSADKGDVNTFDMKLTSTNRTFSGTATEVNIFGADDVLFLTSEISGMVKQDGSVSFVKTYDGAGGVSHSVTYTGQLDDSGRRIRGTYRAETITGKFEMVR